MTMERTTVEGFELSPQQGRLWTQAAGAPGPYRASAAVRVRGPLDGATLRRGLDALVARHEILRTRFRRVPGLERPLQVVADGGVELVEEDLRGLDGEARAARREALEASFAAALLDLEAGPVLRVLALRLAADDHRLLLVLPALAADRPALGHLVADLAAACAGDAGDGGGETLQYADVSEWQHSLLSPESAAEDPDAAAGQSYWRERSSAVDTAAGGLPTDPFRPAFHATALPEDADRRLEAVARELEVPPPVLLLVAWGLLLDRRLAGSRGLTVGVAFDGRQYEELARATGLLARRLPVPAPTTGTVAEAASSVAALLAEHGERQEYFPPAGGADRWGFEAGELPPPFTAGGREWCLEHRRAVWDRLDLGLVVERRSGPGEDRPGSWTLELIHDVEVLESAVAGAMVQRFMALLDRLLEAPEAPLASFGVLTLEEERWLAERNATAEELGGPRTLHGLVRAQAERSPEALALGWGEGDGWSYGELVRRAESLAGELRRRGVAPGVRVALAVERSPAMVVGILAILEAGGAYVPLDPEYPRHRLEWILDDSAVTLLVTTPAVRETLGRLPPGVVLLNGDGTLRGEEAPAAATGGASAAGPDDAAYVIYTSGSTGRPKGVVVPHRAITNRLLWMQREFPVDADDRVLQKTPYGFDASLWEIFVPLLAGARLELAEPGGHRDAAYLAAAVRERGITVLQLVPSQLAVFVEQAGAARSCAGLRTLFCGGEALPAGLARRAAVELGGEVGGCRVVNLYGPTEVSIDATFHPLDGAGPEAPVVPIGRPLANVRVHVADSALRRLPPGEPGELLVGGEGLAWGYLGRPGLTAGRFVPDPFATRPGERLYRTGDRSRWRRLPDGKGELEFLGRTDDQVKLRGMRVELGEVEAVLAGHPAVREAAVAVREMAPGDLRLVAYAVPASPPPAESEVVDYLRGRLPDGMLPAHLTLLDELPRLPSGKLDRAALPEPRFTDSREDHLPPRTPLEELLAGIWSEVLAVERVGVRDSFFRLGGHSLAATRVLTRIRQALGTEMGLRELLAAPTVESLAEQIEAAATRVELPPLVPVPRDAELPLSFAQQRHWFLHQLDPASPLYNLTEALELRGSLAVPALVAALRRVVDRHEVLRTSFPVGDDGEPRQRVELDVRLEVPRVDLSALPPERREGEGEWVVARAAATPFDLERAPLLRAVLVRLEPAAGAAPGGGVHRLVLAMHHTVADAEAFATLHRELEELYAAAVAGRPARLPRLPVQYADYAHWQRRALAATALPRWIEDQRKALAGAPAEIALPFDHPRPPEPRFESRWHHFELPPDAEARLAELGQRAGATGFMTLMAVFAALLHRLSGQEDLVLGTPIVLRDRAEVENLVGCFLNVLPLRVDAAGDPSFEDFLGRVRSAVLDGFARKDVPFEKLVEELNPPRRRNLWPLFQVIFNLKTEVGRPLRLGGLEVETLDADRALPTKYDLTLYLERRGDRIAGSVAYKAALFEPSTVERMMDRFVELLTDATERPETPLGRLGRRSRTERKRTMSIDSKQRGASNLDKLKGMRRRRVTVAPQDVVEMGYLEGCGKLPRLVTPRVEGADLADWLRNNPETLEKELEVHGAVLFRGFPVPDPEVFEEISRVVAPQLLNYMEGSSPRIMVTDRVYTSTEYPPEYFVSMHNELSYAHRWPARLMFHCVTEPKSGGETPIADSRRVLEVLPEDLKRRFVEKGVTYTRKLHGGRGAGLAWQTVFETDDRQVVEDYCREGGIEMEWLDNGGLRTRQVRPAVIRHPRTGDPLWFNQADQFHPSNLGDELSESLAHVASEEDLPINACFGDGTPMEAEELDRVRDAFRQVMVVFPWRQGDVLVLDNMRVAHGRMPFERPRKVVVAMGSPVELSEVTVPKSLEELEGPVSG